MTTLRPALLLALLPLLMASAGCDMFLPDAGGYGQRCLASDENRCAEGLVADTAGGDCWCMDPAGERCRSNQDCQDGQTSQCIDDHCAPCNTKGACLHLGFGNCLIDTIFVTGNHCVGCLTPADCAPGSTCEPFSLSCDTNSTACTQDADCASTPTPRCYPDEGVCGPCQEDADCAGLDGFKNRCVYGACRECGSYTDCPMSQPCQAGTCQTMCTSDADCTSYLSDHTTICNHEGFCSECKEDADCAALSQTIGPVPGQCLPFWGRCSECRQDADCPTGLVCKDQRWCVECASAADCPDSGNCYLDRCTACTPGAVDGCPAGQICVGGACLAGSGVSVAHQNAASPQPLGNLAFGHSTAHPTLLAYGHRGEDGGVLSLGDQGVVATVASLDPAGSCDPNFVLCATAPTFRPAHPDGQLLVGSSPGDPDVKFDPWEYGLYEASDDFATSTNQSGPTTRMVYRPDGQTLVSVDVSDDGAGKGLAALVHRDLADLTALADPLPLDLYLGAPLQDILVFSLIAGPDGSQLAIGYQAVDNEQTAYRLTQLVTISDSYVEAVDQCGGTGPECGWLPHVLAFSLPASGPATFLAAGGGIGADGADYDQGWLGIWDLADIGKPNIFRQTLRGEPSGWTPRPMGLVWIAEHTLLVLTRDGQLRVLLHPHPDFASWVFAGAADLFGYDPLTLPADTPAGGLAHDDQTDWLAAGGSDELKLFRADAFLKEVIGFGYPCQSGDDCPAAFPVCGQPYGPDSSLLCTRSCTLGQDSDCKTATVLGVCEDWSDSPLCTVPY